MPSKPRMVTIRVRANESLKKWGGLFNKLKVEDASVSLSNYSLRPIELFKFGTEGSARIRRPL